MCKRVLLLPIHCDVNCSCGLCWTLMWRGCFFSSRFMFRCSVMESMSMVTFTPVIFFCSCLPHSSLFSSSPLFSVSALYSSLPFSSALLSFVLLQLLLSGSVSPILFFPFPCLFSLATGQRRNCNVYETL